MSRSRLALCVGCAALVGLAPTTSRADLVTDAFVPFDGTTRYDAAIQAAMTNARVYGAVGSLERNVMPNLTLENSFVAVLENNQLWSAARIPGRCTGSALGACKNGRLALYDVDTFASSLALGARFDYFGIFYAASVTGTAVFDDSLTRYFGYNGIVPAYGMYYSLAAPFSDTSTDPGLGKVQRDWIGGVSLDSQFGHMRVGYLGSSGLFTNITEEHVRAFLTAVVQDQFKELPLFKGGIDRLPWRFLDQEVQPYVGMTSAYARKVQFVSPALQGAEPEPREALEERATADFWTSHFEHRGLGSVLDFAAAWGMEPNAFLHELRGAIHTPGFHLPGVGPDPLGGDYGDLNAGGGLLSVGMVRLPRMPEMGVDGGKKLTVSFEAQGRFEGGFLKLSIRKNDPETLAMFPFAQDAWNVYWVVGTGGGE